LKIDSPLSWNTISETSDLLAGHQIGEAELFFLPKFRKKLTKQIKKRLIALKTKKAEPQKEAIQFDDFAKMDIRVGTILEAEKCQSKQIVSIENRPELMFAPLFQELQRALNQKILLVKKVTVLVNLAPRNLVA
jgi:methionyl-tRNA synthetase